MENGLAWPAYSQGASKCDNAQDAALNSFETIQCFSCLPFCVVVVVILVVPICNEIWYNAVHYDLEKLLNFKRKKGK